MAYSFSINNTITSSYDGLIVVKQALVSAGWVVKSSSNGVGYVAEGDSWGPTGDDIDNPNAWIRIQSPLVSDQRREFIFQRSSTARGGASTWTVRYSPRAGFTEGSPGIGVSPTATDQATVSSSIVLFSGMSTVTPGRLHIVTGGSEENYSFYFVAFFSGYQTPRTAFFLDVMRNGSYPLDDLDPAVVYSDTTTGGFAFGDNMRTTSGGGYIKSFMGSLNSAGFVSTIATRLTGFPAVIGTNAWTNKDDSIPVMYTSSGGGRSGVKGWSSMFRYNGVSRANLDTLSVSSTKDRLYINGLLLPWNGTDPTI